MNYRLLLPLLLLALGGRAQFDCSGLYYPVRNGSKVVMKNYNEKDKYQGRVEYVFTAVTATSAEFSSTMYDEKEKPLMEPTSGKVSCDGGTLKVDMRNMLPSSTLSAYKDMRVEGTFSSLDLPSSLSVGMSLPDGSAHLSVYMEDGSQLSTIDWKITKRTVVSRESITTPLGTFDAFRIAYDLEMKTKTMGMGIPITMKVVEFYAPGKGLLRSESYDIKGKLQAYSVVTEMS